MSLWILYKNVNFSEVFQPNHHSNLGPYKGKGHWLRGQVKVQGKRHLLANGQSMSESIKLQSKPIMNVAQWKGSEKKLQGLSILSH